MITAHNLTKKFNRAIAVDDVSFELKEGENLVLLGTSGCGKTTTLKMVNRLVEPSSGKIFINGKDISSQSPEALRRSIGYVLQQNSLFPHYTVAGNIAVVPNLLGWDKKKIELRTNELLERLNLPVSCLSVYPHELSGGQQQRVNIARALAADPPVLLMDEPFGALDNITRTKIGDDFSEIQEFMAKTIIMVTHDVQEAFRIGDRVALMNGGKIVQVGKPTELLFHPVTDFVRDFFSSSYLRLALGAVKVQDIWGQLPPTNNDDQDFDTLSKNENLWDLMEQFTNRRNQYINLQNNDGEVKQVTQPELFSAFNKYVNHI